MANTLKKTSNEYAEGLMQAMDTIIQERINKLAFDRTITCKIISQDEKDSNLYWVSTDTMKFKARTSGNEKYSKGEEVYVLVPEGNYDNEKVITGSRINDIEKAYNKMKYISTKEQFVEYNKINFDGNINNINIKTTKGEETNSTDSLITDIDFKYNLPIERIGIEFSLDTIELFGNVQEKGQYGLLINYIEDPGENILWNTRLSNSFIYTGNNESLKFISFNTDKSSIYNGEELQGIPLLAYSSNGNTRNNFWLFLDENFKYLRGYCADAPNETPKEINIDPLAKAINSWDLLQEGDNPSQGGGSVKYWFIPVGTTGTLFQYEATGYMSSEDYQQGNYETVTCNFDINNLFQEDNELYVLKGSANNQYYYRYSAPTFDDCISAAGFLYQGSLGHEDVSNIDIIYQDVLISSDYRQKTPELAFPISLGRNEINLSEWSNWFGISKQGIDINGNWAKIQQYFVHEVIPGIATNSQTLYSAELYGNPYAFTESFNHFVLLPFELSDITKIKQMEIKLFQDGNFEQTNKTITLSNVSLSFGFEKGSENIGKSRLILGNNQSLEFNRKNAESRDLYVNMVSGENIYNDLNPLVSGSYDITYFHYIANHKDESYFIDEHDINNSINSELWNWEKLISTSSFVHRINLNTKQAIQTYKAVIRYNKKEEKYQDYIITDIIKFEDKIAIEKTGATSTSDGIKLVLENNNTGVYNIYNIDGSLADYSKRGPYSITVEPIDGRTWDEVEQVVWYFPEGSSMIIQTAAADENATVDDLKTVHYTLNDNYATGITNNIVKCKVKFKNEKDMREATITFQFGYISTSGTNYSLNIDFADEGVTCLRPCLTVGEINPVKVKATFSTKTGEYVQIPDTDIHWSWVFPKASEFRQKYENGEPLFKKKNISYLVQVKNAADQFVHEQMGTKDRPFYQLQTGEYIVYNANNQPLLPLNTSEKIPIYQVLVNENSKGEVDGQGNIKYKVDDRGYKILDYYKDQNGNAIQIDELDENGERIPDNQELSFPYAAVDGKIEILTSVLEENEEGIEQVIWKRYDEPSWANSTDTTNTTITKEFDEDITGSEICIAYLDTVIPEKNYGILKAEVKNYGLDNGITANLVAYLPIPIGDNSDDPPMYMSGAQRVIYEGLGNSASYSSEKYEIYPKTIDKNTYSTWELGIDPDQLKDEAHWEHPSLRIIENENPIFSHNEYSLQIPTYAPINIPKVCIKGSINNEIKWISPILVLQDTWDKELLNDWDGSFRIDEEEGIIMSSLLVAGKKEGQYNEFTGVLVGDVAKAGGVERHTGVYGYKQGVNRFRLTDNGEFFIGTGEGNRIFFNGDELTVDAKVLNISVDTIDITTTNNKFILRGGGSLTSQLKLGDKFSYNEENNTAIIAGWTITNTALTTTAGSYTIKIACPTQEGGPGNSTHDFIKLGKTDEPATYDFLITSNGYLFCNNANITGIINASSGTAHSWEIKDPNNTTYGYFGYWGTEAGGEDYGINSINKPLVLTGTQIIMENSVWMQQGLEITGGNFTAKGGSSISLSTTNNNINIANDSFLLQTFNLQDKKYGPYITTKTQTTDAVYINTDYMGLYFNGQRVIGIGNDKDICIGSGGQDNSLPIYLWGSRKLDIKTINGVNHVIVVT